MKKRWNILSFRVGISLFLKGLLIAAILIRLYMAADRGGAVKILEVYGYGFVFLLLGIFDYFLLVRPFGKMRSMENCLVQNPKDFLQQQSMPYTYNEDGRKVERALCDLIDDMVQLNSEMKQSEFLALQNQINPHFLYNTLDGIRSDAMKVKAYHIADLIEALSSFFAYTISNMDQYATIYEEMEHVKEYYYIQKYRFKDKLNMEFDNSEGAALREFYMPRLVLQPLVENAISHGMEVKKNAVTISISFLETGKDITIHVRDDGVGMDEAALTGLNRRLDELTGEQEESRKKRGGVALVNVNKRIKMLAGKEYGMHVYSVENEGTDVMVRLPKIVGEDINEEGVS